MGKSLKDSYFISPPIHDLVRWHAMASRLHQRTRSWISGLITSGM
jgi:hypothetical protein